MTKKLKRRKLEIAVIHICTNHAISEFYARIIPLTNWRSRKAVPALVSSIFRTSISYK